jgi:MscS family membrane protein
LHAIAGMSDLTSWNVLELVVSAAIAYLGGRLVGNAVHRMLYRFALTTRTASDDRIVTRLSGPIAALCAVGIWEVMIAIFDFPLDVLAFLRELGSIAFLLALAWLGMRILDGIVETAAVKSKWITGHRISHSLLPVARRAVKVVLAVIIALMILSELGYSVGPLIAGLGITGIAVALAAQKTLENVFGAFAIGVDHPFHEGDMIKLDNGRIGKVESIGLRSTRLRTADRTLVTVPNGKLADAQIEALTARDCIRFATTLHVALGASPKQIDRAIGDLTDMLRTHPRRAEDQEPRVHLAAICDSWLELEVAGWLATTDWDEFCVLRERLLMRCLELVEAAGLALHNAPPPAVPAAPATRPQGALSRSQGGLS